MALPAAHDFLPTLQLPHTFPCLATLYLDCGWKRCTDCDPDDMTQQEWETQPKETRRPCLPSCADRIVLQAKQLWEQLPRVRFIGFFLWAGTKRAFSYERYGPLVEE